VLRIKFSQFSQLGQFSQFSQLIRTYELTKLTKLSKLTEPVVLLLLLAVSAYAAPWSGIIDPSRAIDWSQTGIPGGIPNRTTVCATLNPGVTAAQINSAILACPSGQVVKLNAGTYNLASGIDFANKSNVTLRGAGPDQTFLIFSDGTGCFGLWADVCLENGTNSWGGAPSHSANWTAGYAKGTTQVTLSDTSGLQPGSLLMLDQLNDSETDTGGIWVCEKQGICADEGGQAGRVGRAQTQVVRVTAVSGNNVMITPGLYMPNWRASLAPGAFWTTSTISNSGVEDMTLDHTASGNKGFGFNTSYNCWVKNIKDLNSNRDHIDLFQALGTVVRDSYFYGTQNAASQSYGVESFISADTLVENNIFQHVTAPMIANGTASGTVYGYNFAIDDYYLVSPNWMIGSNVSHAAGIDMVLHEGNDAIAFTSDDIHGTRHFVTAFRNYFTGWEPGKTAQTMPINIYQFGRYTNIIGNVLGHTGYHNNYEWSVAGSNYNTSIYALGSDTISSPQGDPLVKTTLLRWGNYDTVTATSRFLASEVPSGLSQYANPVPVSQTLPASIYLAAKPAFFGSLPWPPIGPDVIGGNVSGVGGHANKIPAHVCYDNTAKDANGILLFNANTCYGSATTTTNACDLNGDTNTNVSDVQLCVNQAIGSAACSGGDINKDNTCNVVDVQRTVNAALGGQCVSQ
jgi:hypothetical protein